MKQVSIFIFVFVYSAFILSCVNNKKSPDKEKFVFTVSNNPNLNLQNSTDYLIKDTLLIQNAIRELQGKENAAYRQTLYQKLGLIHFQNHHFESALENHKQYLELSKQLNDSVQILKALNLLASENLQLQQITQAVDYYFEAYDMFYKMDPSNNENLETEKTITLKNIGYLYQLLGYQKEAQEYYKQSYPHNNTLIRKNLTPEDQATVNRFSPQELNRAQASAYLLYKQLEFDKDKNNKELSELKSQINRLNHTQKNDKNVSKIIIISLIALALILFHFLMIRKRKKSSNIQVEKMRTDFFMKITHEFKTPISLIIGLTDKLRRNLNENNRSESLIDLSIISRQSQNLLYLVNEILNFSKMQLENKTQRQNDNIVEYVKYLYSCFSNFAESRGIVYEFKTTAHEILMDYSPEQIAIIINNLISNSLKHCDNGDKISVLIDKDKARNKIIIKIIDSGEGILEKDLPHIFERFYQSESDNFKQTGTGIGLYFTKQIIESLGGKIISRSIPFHETTFTVELPINNTEPENVNPSNRANCHKLAIHSNHLNSCNKEDNNKPLLLLADDCPDMLFYLTSMLNGDYNIIPARNGNEAIEIANDKIPDLIVSDLVMPFADGVELCKKLKESVMTNHIPIIILTATTAEGDKIKSIKSGADAFLSKPFAEEELKAKIEQLLISRKQLREKYTRIILDYDYKNNETSNDANLAYLQKVTHIIYRELNNNDFFPQGLADELCVTPVQLNRKIKSISGISCTNYISTMRLNKAKKMLLISQKPIGEIAMDCGFNDFSYFCKSFKKQFGITPSKFQNTYTTIN